MALHYKHFFNNSNKNEFCWMHNDSMIEESDKTDAFTAIKYLPSWFIPAGRTYAHVVCFSGLTLNFLIAAVLLKNSRLRKESLTPCIVSLTMANILCYIGGIGYKLSKRVLSPKSQFRCHTYGAAVFISMLCSAINLFGIASLRCIKFNFSRRFEDETFKRASLLIAIGSWIGACAILMPTATGNWGQFGWECKSKRCRFINYNNYGTLTMTEPEKMYYSLKIAIGIVNLLMNLGTYIKVKQDCKKTASDIEGFNLKAASYILKKEKRVTKMLVLDSLQYLVLFLPKAILHLKDPYSPTNEPLTHLIFFTLWYTSGFIEALVILLFQRKYRKEILVMLRSICSCSKNEPTAAESTNSKRKVFESRHRNRAYTT